MPQGFAQSTLGRCQNITPYYRITDSRRHVSTIWVEFTLGENASFVEKFSRWLRRNLQWEMMEKCHFSIFWTLLSKHRFFNEPLQRKRRKSRDHAFMFNFLFTICRTVPSFQRNDFNNLCQGNMFQDVLHLNPGHYQSCGLHIFYHEFWWIHPWRLTWNIIMEVWFRSLSFLNGWFVGSMLVFQGVCKKS